MTTPTAVMGGVTSWEAISAGDRHTCGLAAANGAAYCWGEALCNFEAKWSQSMSTTAADSFIRAALPVCGQRPCGVHHCLLCFAGKNSYGQVGNGNINTPVISPTAVVGSISSWATISAGGYHSCGLAAANGQVYCWGEALCIFEAHCNESLITEAAYSLTIGCSAGVRILVVPGASLCPYASQATMSTAKSVTETSTPPC